MISANYLMRLARKAVKKLLLQNPNSLYGKKELRLLEERMDRGDFTFSPEEETKMIQQWHFCVSECPLPAKIKDIYYNSGDAFAMNSFDVANVSFKLPYGIAFEEAQKAGYQKFVDFVVASRVSFDNAVVLDAGCGFGGLLACVHDNFPTAICMGIECVPSAKEYLTKKRPWIRVYIADMESDKDHFQRQFPHKADVIFCSAVLEHLRKPAEAVRNLLSVKAKGGVLILSVPDGRMDRAAQHIQFWSYESWTLFIQEAARGYQIEFPKTAGSVSIGYDLCAVIRDP